MKGRSFNARIAAGLGAAVGCVGLVASIVAVTAAQASTPTPPLGPALAYHGAAYGTQVHAGSVASSGPSFRIVSTCGGKVGQTWTNSGASTSVPGALRSRTITNQVRVAKTKTGQAVTSSSKVQSVNLLKGTILAAGLDAVSTITLTSGGQFVFKDGSSFGRISIGGQSVSVSQPNQKVPISGLGYAIVDQQKRSSNGVMASQIINLIHVFVTVANNSFGLDKGSSIIVGHAATAVASVSNGLAGGIAFSSRVVGGGPAYAGSGMSAPAYMPCFAASRSNEIASVNVPNAGTGSAGANHISWNLTKQGDAASGSSSLQTVNLLGGMIKAKSLHVSVHGTQVKHTYSFTNRFSQVNLVVNGQAITGAQSQTIPLNGLGTLYIHRVVQTKKSETVRALELVVSHKNSYGLPVGADVQIGVAKIKFNY